MLVLLLMSFKGYTQEALPRFLQHTVKKGETVASICNKYGVDVQDFAALNNFPPSADLDPGQVVLIRPLKEGEVLENAEVSEKKVAKPSEVKPTPETEVKAEPVETVSPDFESTRTTKKAADKKTVTDSKASDSKTTDSKTSDSKASENATTRKPVSVEKSAPVSTAKTTETSGTKRAPVEKSVAPERPASGVVSTAKPGEVPRSTNKTEMGPGGIVYHVSTSQYHVVERKQTFYRIALIYGLTINELLQLNNLSSTDLRIGQKLRVSK
jgi:LysM repeat protein